MIPSIDSKERGSSDMPEQGFLGFDNGFDLGALEDPRFGQQGLQGLFSSQVQNLGLPFNQQQAASSYFSPLYSQYLGFLTNQIRQGTTPTSGQTFDRFTSGNLPESGFQGLNAFFTGLGPQQRGLNNLRFAPPTRFLR